VGANEVARVLNVPLDVLVVRKLGTPWQRELAMGAIATGDVQVLDLSLVKQLCVPSEAIQEVAASERKELERQERLYRGNRPPLSVAGKTSSWWPMALRLGRAFWPQSQRSASKVRRELLWPFQWRQPLVAAPSGWRQMRSSV
jgi:putative phosphoribosyl transferase